MLWDIIQQTQLKQIVMFCCAIHLNNIKVSYMEWHPKIGAYGSRFPCLPRTFLRVGSSDDRQRCNVKSSFISWVHTQNDLWFMVVLYWPIVIYLHPTAVPLSYRSINWCKHWGILIGIPLDLLHTEPRPWFSINMSSYPHKKSHCGDKTVVRSSHFHNGISKTGKMAGTFILNHP